MSRQSSPLSARPRASACSPPPVPAECPAAEDPPEGKIGDATTVQNRGRQPVVIELRQSLLPVIADLSERQTACDELLNSGWSRTIAGRRMLTCARRFIDSKLRGFAPEVNYQTADGVPSGYPELPPFGDIIHAQTAFALALTWDEVIDAARHPYVERIWTSPSLTVDSPPAGCHPNYAEPVTNLECPAGTESTERKVRRGFDGRMGSVLWP